MGWNAGPWVWGPRPTPPSNPTCPGNLKDASDGGENFIATLLAAKVPFDCTMKINAQASTLQGATALSDRLTLILNKFGARHVHLIAHSKAGMMARKFLKDNDGRQNLDKIGVISVTTLDTPHAGSVLADTIKLFDENAFGGIARELISRFRF